MEADSHVFNNPNKHRFGRCRSRGGDDSVGSSACGAGRRRLDEQLKQGRLRRYRYGCSRTGQSGDGVACGLMVPLECGRELGRLFDERQRASRRDRRADAGRMRSDSEYVVCGARRAKSSTAAGSLRLRHVASRCLPEWGQRGRRLYQGLWALSADSRERPVRGG